MTAAEAPALTQTKPRPTITADALGRAYSVALVAAQCATLALTWGLWEPHTRTPMLPLLSFLPSFPMAVLMLVTVLFALPFPRAGAVSHIALLLYSMLVDQTRMQPQLLCHAILLLGCAYGAPGRSVARMYLAAVWFYAGFHKLLSTDFIAGTSQWILHGLVKQPPPWLERNAGYIIGASELLLGLLSLVPRARRLVTLYAFCLHMGILLDLSPWGHNWNHAVWPWNFVLALSGFGLFWKADRPLFREVPRSVWPLLAVISLAPATYYVGVWDPYMAHHLYSEAVPTVQWCTQSNDCRADPGMDETMAAYRVPLPPTPRILLAYFRARCAPGDRMTLRDKRAWAKARGTAITEVRCHQ